MCRALEVSHSGFYAWLNRKPTKRSQEDEKYKPILAKAFNDSGKTYGCSRLQSVLENMGYHVGTRRVARLQREEKLFPVQRKKFYHTTEVDPKQPVCGNLVNQDFRSDSPNRL